MGKMNKMKLAVVVMTAALGGCVINVGSGRVRQKVEPHDNTAKTVVGGSSMKEETPPAKEMPPTKDTLSTKETPPTKKESGQ